MISVSNNMIVLAGDDSIWKNSSEKTVSLLGNEEKSKEDEFEDYLEDLLF